MLNRSLVLSALMTVVVTGNVLAAEYVIPFTGVVSSNYETFGVEPDKVAAEPGKYEHFKKWIVPFPTYGGRMTYVTESYVDNIVKLNSLKFGDGLLVPAGFYAVRGNLQNPVTVRNNILSMENCELSLAGGGYFECVGGYLGYNSYGEIIDNSVKINESIVIARSILIAGALPVGEKNNNEVIGKRNEVEINSSSLYSADDATICGGVVNQNGNVVKNKVTIKDSNLNGLTEGVTEAVNELNDSNSKKLMNSIAIYGGLQNKKGDANKNIVNIVNCDIAANEQAEICGGCATEGKAKRNTVNINTSIFEGSSIFGGYTSNGNAKGNAVDIRNTDLIDTGVYGGCAGTGNANKNILNIDTVDFENSKIYGGYSDNGNASNNNLSLDDVEFKNGSIYAGYTDNGNAKGNVVNLKNTNLSGSSLYGGFSKSGGDIDRNTLNLGANITGKLCTIGGFNTINFANIDWENGGTIIETENLELVDTAVNIQNITGDPKVNDYMNLIVSDNEITGKLINQGEQTVKVSAAQVVKTTTGNLEQESNAIKFTIVGSELNPQVGALGDANAIAGAFVANGAGLVEDSINAMMCEERIGYKTFAQVHGSNLDFDTPNNLNVKGWSGIVGVGETTKDRITYGMFFETGKGDYYTLAQQSTGYVRGDGELDYRGGGVLVRKDNENGTYVEASLRAGRMDNELNDAVLDGHNELQGFDISSTYYGAHIGVGKIIPRGERESLDVYGKFLYSRYDGDSFVIDGDKFNLDDVDSQKLRVGFRYNELNGEKLRMYYGAAYEYEFDTKAKNSVLNYTFDSPDLGGSTIIGELGFHYNADEKWCFDVNLRGYGGEREGISGSIQANYMF